MKREKNNIAQHFLHHTSLQKINPCYAQRVLFIPKDKSGPKRKLDASVEEPADQMHSCEITRAKGKIKSPGIEICWRWMCVFSDLLSNYKGNQRSNIAIKLVPDLGIRILFGLQISRFYLRS